LLARAAPVAVVVGALSGLISSSFYALVPAWMQDEGIARETIAMSMLVAVLGGLAFQVPIGRLSDRFDRRIVWPRLALALRAPPSLWSLWTQMKRKRSNRDSASRAEPEVRIHLPPPCTGGARRSAKSMACMVQGLPFVDVARYRRTAAPP
jgi:hypothetical protein